MERWDHTIDGVLVGIMEVQKPSPYIGERKAEELTEKEYDALTDADWDKLNMVEGHKLVGEISTTVWRWEGADKDHLGDSYQKTLDANHVADPVLVDVVNGKWKFTHYYRSNEHSDDVYARLQLQG